MKTKLKTDKKEDFKSKYKRILFNFFPAYRRSGGRICFISSDGKEIHVKLGLNWTTKNYVGTVFGGSIYAALDPIYMVQLINLLGKDYIVWDKSAEIYFKSPIKKTVFARFLITDELFEEIKEQIKKSNKYIINLEAYFEDEKGEIYAKTSKEIFIAKKDYFKQRVK